MTKNYQSSIQDEKEKRAVQLSLGQVKPKNEKEKRMVEQMEEIKKKGGIIEIPTDN